VPFFAAALIAIASALPACADPIEGLWKTTPQADGSVGFDQIAPCWAGFCGNLVKGMNAAGEVATSGGNMGKQILWDMQARGAGL